MLGYLKIYLVDISNSSRAPNTVYLGALKGTFLSQVDSGKTKGGTALLFSNPPVLPDNSFIGTGTGFRSLFLSVPFRLRFVLQDLFLSCAVA